MSYGGIEAGGTTWVCAVGADGGRIAASETLPTTTPDETLARAVAFFRAHGPIDALGIGSFGPVDIRRESPTWGRIAATPKPGWSHVDVVSPLREALGVPVAIDTDVGAAALGEWRHGAAAGLETVSYVTVGTGIGCGSVVGGRILHGSLHPELGHIRVPHDRDRDPFDGACPYHGDCLEGLASGTAIRMRTGVPAEELESDETWELVTGYLALGLLALVYALSPQRIVLGGGVSRRRGLRALVRRRLRELLAGYAEPPELAADPDRYVVAPGLGELAGVAGAIELAPTAVAAG